MIDELRTDRLLLRGWRDTDREPWATMNADPRVREFFGSTLTREQADASIDRFQAALEARGWGWWAVEERATGRFLGFAGLDPTDERTPVDGVEIGWRLAPAAWGHGYATEAGRACLAYGFERLGLPEIIAVAAAGNERSRAVMRRLGMIHDPSADYADPRLPEGPIRATVIHRLPRPS